MEAVKRLVRRAGDFSSAPAVASGTTKLTYAEFLARVARDAAFIRRRQARRVLIALPSGAAAYAAMFAVLAAGATYCPLNLAAPAIKQRRILSSFRPDLIITDAEADMAVWQSLPETGIVFSADIPPLDGPADIEVVESDAPAYVIYTSGSTGVPKGVVIGRPALDHYISWIGDSLRLGPDDRVNQYANIAFDLSVLEIYGALCHGASLFPVVNQADRIRPAQMIEREALTVWIGVPSVLGLMLHAGDVTATRLGTVRRFVFCGEALPTHYVTALFASVPGTVVQNTYGPTETTVSVTSCLFDAQNFPALSHGAVAIGEPIDDMSIHLDGLTDGNTEQMGEIVICGPQLATGYWEDQPATAAAFREIMTVQGMQRGYFTGDYGRRADGALFFVSRKDFQIKHKGHRIETGEIVRAFAEFGYDDACIFQADGKLVAAVASELPLDQNALSNELRARLEAYAVPETIFAMANLPRNENDKIDQAAIIAAYAAYTTHRQTIDGDALDAALAFLNRIANEEAEMVLIPQHAKPGDSSRWDSYKHISVFIAVEARLGRNFTPAEFERTLTMAGFAKLIASLAQETALSLD